MPRDSAVSAYSNSRSGVRCADTIFVSCGTPRASRSCAACCMVSQSDLEPIISPTSASANYSSCTPFPLSPRLDPPFQSSLQIIQRRVICDQRVVELVLIRRADVVQCALLQIFKLRLLLELEEKIADTAEAFAVMRSDPVQRESGDVFAGGVAGVVVPNIVRIAPGEPSHEEVARDLGEDGCAGDAEAPNVSVYHRGVGHGESAYQSAVDHDMIGCYAQPSQRALHGQCARLIDIDAIDFVDRCGANGERDGTLPDYARESDAVIVRQALGVVHAGDGASVAGHDHGTGDYGTCNRA